MRYGAAATSYAMLEPIRATAIHMMVMAMPLPRLRPRLVEVVCSSKSKIAVISVILVQDEVKSFRVIAGLVFIPLFGCRLELCHVAEQSRCQFSTSE